MLTVVEDAVLFPAAEVDCCVLHATKKDSDKTAKTNFFHFVCF